MNKFSITFLMNFLIVISAPDTKPRDIFTKTKYYKVITGDEAAKSLRGIQSSEALPLVLYMDNVTSELGPLEGLGEIYVNNGRIINQTQFTRQRAGEQMFFCPKKNSHEKCLVRKDFHALEPLECSEEPEPIVTPPKDDTSERECGPNDAGKSYDFAYEICPDEIFSTKTSYSLFSSRKIEVYTFCYNEKEKHVIGTLHRIIHPKLLHSEILSKERNVHYHMKAIDGFDLANQQTLETAIAMEKSSPTSSDDSEHQNKKQKTNQHVYRAQKLVPEEDMAFALLRKPIFQYINLKLQHEKLIPLWNDINHYIRLHTEEISKNTNGIRPYIATSVFELTPIPRKDGQMTNMWVKLVYFEEPSRSEGEDSTSATGGLVILMNNFVDIGSDNSTKSNSEGKTIDDYCQQNTCEESLENRFAAVGGSVRCCPMSENVSEIFGSGTHAIGKTSRIPGINGA